MKTMKYLLFLALSICLSTISEAQIPKAFSYQAIAMDSSGELIVNSPIGIQIEIVKSNFDGQVVYVETHEVMSTELGHINLEVGRGETNDSMEDVFFQDDIHFLDIKMDVNGGTDYQIGGIVQLLSVPIAHYAQVSLTGDQGPPGVAGLAGFNGATGATGATGVDGLQCWDLNGNGIGDPNEDKNADNLYDVEDCRGPTGTTGAAGATGATGATGLTGPAGPEIGDPGPPGDPGPQGDPGPFTGIAGEQGPKGPKGLTGAQGAMGPKGDPGDPGPGGGIKGLVGPMGPQGTDQGEKGLTGAAGPAGIMGATGLTGMIGPAGPNGITAMEMRSSPPTTVTSIYLDDGTNRDDGRPGFRVMLQNGEWTDL